MLAGAERAKCCCSSPSDLWRCCGLVGMSIDVGQLVFTRTDLQKVADVSALAGVEDLASSTSNATTSANVYATKNGASTTQVTFGSANTVITVKAARHVDYTFLKVLDIERCRCERVGKREGSADDDYAWSSVAPFIVWGGSRTSEVHAGDQNCPPPHLRRAVLHLLGHGLDGSQRQSHVAGLGSEREQQLQGDINHGCGGAG